MRILLALTYYRPHVSGLTIYVERLARALARRGHAVTVLTSQYDRALPREETRDGVRVLRVPVALRVSKGVIMPTIGLVATREVLRHDVLSLQVEVISASPQAVRAFAEKHGLQGKTVIGMAARLATEKGVEVLLEALPAVMAEHPDLRVLFAGAYQNVTGEAAYARRLAPLLERFREQWTFLGVLDAAEMAAFYANCHATVLPSLNSTESFGLVQIESMICGAPVVASNLPGVRQPVRMTGMGEVAAVRDAADLADKLKRVLGDRDRYLRDGAEIARHFSPDATAEAYERLFEELGQK
ncbi:MAG: glycosyltransferase family 4 protein [Chloroflexi bacterium]|nr:glycosyltransferase family 4 protein [Chloroflexota bacterium]